MSNTVRMIDKDGVVAFVPWEVIRKLGFAVEEGCTEETQRRQHGDLTVNWMNELTKAMIDEGKVPR